MDIYICEDNKKQRDTLEKLIISLTNDSDFDIALSTDNPKSLLLAIEKQKNTNIYFLDIDLNSTMNGFELAKEIRKNDLNGYIIFLTSHAELTLLTFKYKVRALDYILKGSISSIKEKISECFEEISKDLSKHSTNSKKTISINTGDNITFYDLDDIIFFETANKDHKIKLHTVFGFVEFYGTLKDIQKSLNEDFYKTHRSYIINTKKIKKIDKNNLIIYMDNNEECYVASRYLKGLLEKCLT